MGGAREANPLRYFLIVLVLLLTIPPAAIAVPPGETYILKIYVPAAGGSAEVTVFINGTKVGVFMRSTSTDVTRFLKVGTNTVKIASRSEGLPLAAEATIGVNRNGKWATVVSHKIHGTSPLNEKAYTVTVLGRTARTLSATYVLKVYVPAAGGKGEFTVFINGTRVGTFTDSTSIEVTGFLKRGTNTVKIVSVSQGLPLSASVVVGTNRSGKWTPLLSHKIGGTSPLGEKTYTIAVQ
jgi:hypothetical protein